MANTSTEIAIHAHQVVAAGWHIENTKQALYVHQLTPLVSSYATGHGVSRLQR